FPSRSCSSNGPGTSGRAMLPGIALTGGLPPERFVGLPDEPGGELSSQPGRVALSRSGLPRQQWRHRNCRSRAGRNERTGEHVAPAGGCMPAGALRRLRRSCRLVLGGSYKGVPLSPHLSAVSFPPSGGAAVSEAGVPCTTTPQNQSLLGKLRRFTGGNIPLFRDTANIPLKGG